MTTLSSLDGDDRKVRVLWVLEGDSIAMALASNEGSTACCCDIRTFFLFWV